MTEATTTAPLKVAIVGKAPSTILDAPYDDGTWEIWTLSNNAQLGEAKRWSRHFEIHRLTQFRDDPARADYWEWLRSEPAGKRPIYTQGETPEVPASTAFPIEACVQQFGGYFNNTVSYLVAFAIMEGAAEIGVFGVDMAVGGNDPNAEYSHQRPSCEYMIGVARGMGIPVHVPKKSDLLKVRHLYGFGVETDYDAKMDQRTAELKSRRADAENRLEAAKQEVCGIMGAMDNLNYMRQWA